MTMHQSCITLGIIGTFMLGGALARPTGKDAWSADNQTLFRQNPIVGKSVDVSQTLGFADPNMSNRGGHAILKRDMDTFMECYSMDRSGAGSSTKEAKGTSAYSFSDDMASQAGIEAGYGPFSMSVKATMKTGSSVSEDRSYVKNTQFYTKGSLSVDLSCYTDERYVDSGFMDNLKRLSKEPLSNTSRQTPQWKEYMNFIKTWGTHVVTNANEGASLDVSMSISNTKTTESSNLDVAMKASYGAFFSGNVEHSKNLSESKSSLDMELKTEIYGGSNALRVEVNAMLSKVSAGEMPEGYVDAIKNWGKSVDNNPGSFTDPMYKPWSSIMGARMGAVVSENIERATKVHMLSKWKLLCDPASWDERDLKCKTHEHLPRLNNPIQITDTDGKCIYYDHATSSFRASDKSQTCGAFKFDMVKNKYTMKLLRWHSSMTSEHLINEEKTRHLIDVNGRVRAFHSMQNWKNAFVLTEAGHIRTVGEDGDFEHAYLRKPKKSGAKYDLVKHHLPPTSSEYSFHTENTGRMSICFDRLSLANLKVDNFDKVKGEKLNIDFAIRDKDFGSIIREFKTELQVLDEGATKPILEDGLAELSFGGTCMDSWIKEHHLGEEGLALDMDFKASYLNATHSIDIHGFHVEGDRNKHESFTMDNVDVALHELFWIKKKA